MIREQTPNVLWGWMIRGLGGIISMIERAVEDGLEMNDERVSELNRLADRLNKLAVGVIKKWGSR